MTLSLVGFSGPEPRVWVWCLEGTSSLLRLGWVSFHFLRVATCPKANNVLCCRRCWAPVLSGSWNVNEREEVEPGAYVSGLQTHDGFWVMMREA